MKTFLCSVVVLAGSTTSLSAAPQVALQDPFFLTESSSTAQDPIAQVVDLDGPNTGEAWAESAQNSFTNAWTNASASANAWSSTDGEAREAGFYVWGYARSMGDAARNQQSFARSNAFAEVPMLIHEASRITGSICFMGDASLNGSEALCVIERVGGYADDDDNEVIILLSEMCNPNQAACPLDCIEFDIPVEPGQYRFWGSAVSNSVNIESGYHEGWAEFSADIEVRGLPVPDIDGDGGVDGGDLAIFLGGWGSDKQYLDFNGDLKVDGLDLTILLSAWTG